MRYKDNKYFFNPFYFPNILKKFKNGLQVSWDWRPVVIANPVLNNIHGILGKISSMECQ